MKEKPFKLLVVVAAISLLGVIFMQLYWVRDAVQLKEEQFNTSVGIAIKSVLNRILELNTDETRQRLANQQPCTEKTEITDVIRPRLLDSLLRTELGCMKIVKGYEYAVYSKVNHRVIIGNVAVLNDNLFHSEHQLSVEALFNPGNYYLSVYFPAQKSALLMQLFWWMLLSGLFISAVAFSFYYTLKVVLTQKRLSEMKSDFINNMTHEFKTPVATISIAGEMLLKDEILSNPDRAKKYASIILSENKRLQEQAEQVLQSALLEKDAVKLRKQQADVHQIIGEVLESFHLQIKERNGVLNHSFKAAHTSLKIDRFHISNVIANLIDNAIKYSPEILDVQLLSWSNDKGFYLKISDKGMGIAREDMKHIFKNLYRVHTGDRHDVKGFGIGLFYVKKIIEAHGGHITVDSESGKGTSFTLFLPFLSQVIT